MLDANVCISVMNGNPPGLRTRLMQHDPTEVAISQIVRYELEFGVCNSTQVERNAENLRHFLRYVQVLDWGDEQTLAAAQVRCELARRGTPIGPYDILIAGHARSLGVVLVTRNVREFSRVDNLQIEDWHA